LLTLLLKVVYFIHTMLLILDTMAFMSIITSFVSAVSDIGDVVAFSNQVD